MSTKWKPDRKVRTSFKTIKWDEKQYEILAQNIKANPNNLTYAFELTANQIKRDLNIKRSFESVRRQYYRSDSSFQSIRSSLFLIHSTNTAIRGGVKNSKRVEGFSREVECDQYTIKNVTTTRSYKGDNIQIVRLTKGAFIVNNMLIKGKDIRISYTKI